MGVFSFLFVDGPSGSTLVPRWQARDVKMVTPDRRILVSNLRCFLFRNAFFSYASGGIFFHVSLFQSLSHECRILSAQKNGSGLGSPADQIGSGLGSTTRSDSLLRSVTRFSFELVPDRSISLHSQKK